MINNEETIDGGLKENRNNRQDWSQILFEKHIALAHVWTTDMENKKHTITVYSCAHQYDLMDRSPAAIVLIVNCRYLKLQYLERLYYAYKSMDHLWLMLFTCWMKQSIMDDLGCD